VQLATGGAHSLLQHLLLLLQLVLLQLVLLHRLSLTRMWMKGWCSSSKPHMLLQWTVLQQWLKQ
jgi:hypothetical protein